MSGHSHRWRFFRAGGFDQVRLDSAADLLALKSLDQKLWVALACPTEGIEFDPATLKLVDADSDGTVRAPELIQAIDWTAGRLVDPAILTEGLAGLPLTAIHTNDEEGKTLVSAASSLLNALGKADALQLDVADASQGEALFNALPNNGDGIVSAADCPTPQLATLVDEIVAALGGVADCRGAQGIDRATLTAFYDAARARNAWQSAAVSPASAAAHAAVDAVAAKVDDYFVRCRLAAFDPQAAAAINTREAQLLALADDTLSTSHEGIAALPLAHIAADAPLPLSKHLNPAWAEAIVTLRAEAIDPLLGAREQLTEADWSELKQRLEAHSAWLAAKPTPALDALADARIDSILADGSEDQLSALLSADEAQAPQAAAIASVEKLARFVRDLYPLANNFVSFRDFYTRQGKAIFQVGTLFLDGRSAELVVSVNDAGRHAALAHLSRVFLVYCDCRRRDASGVHTRQIAAAFTAGDADQLIVGRNGVFYDRQGNDWIATIAKISDHPISLRQAFWSPYKRLVRMVGEQFQKFAAGKAAAVEGKVDALAADAVVATGTPKPPPPPFDVGKFAGIFAAVGLALGALGTAIASVITGILGLHWWQIPLAFAGLLLAVSGPAVILAWSKLRHRTLGPILDANGWAINARARINIPFGTSLTQLARLPEGAERSLKDPYAEKSTPWGLYLFFIAIAAGAVWWFYFK